MLIISILIAVTSCAVIKRDDTESLGEKNNGSNALSSKIIKTETNFTAVPNDNENTSDDENTGLYFKRIFLNKIPIFTSILEIYILRVKRNPDKSFGKIVLESVRDGTGVFAAGNAVVTVAVPNPATAVAAGIAGFISVIAGTIADRIN